MFVGIEENGTPFDAENEKTNNNVENTKEVIYDFLQRELSFENAQSRFEFQRIHRVGKKTGKSRYSDREDVLHHSKGKITVFLRTCRKNFIN